MQYGRSDWYITIINIIKIINKQLYNFLPSNITPAKVFFSHEYRRHLDYNLVRIAAEVKALNNIIEKIIDEVFSGDNNADGKILSNNLVINNIFYKTLRFLSVESRSGSDSEEDSEENISKYILK